MPLYIQDPTDPETDFLGDMLLDACSAAQVGGGAFAFLSARGVQLLLQDDIFQAFLSRGRFDLLVGVDAITDGAAIDALSEVTKAHPNMTSRVFVPSHPNSIFHPKVAWFDNGNGGLLITGSGNLTLGGLRSNIEAFAIEQLDAAEMGTLRAKWDAYLARTVACQFAPNDDRIKPFLERNAVSRRAIKATAVNLPIDEEKAAPPTDTLKAENEKLPGLPAHTDDDIDKLPPISPETEMLVAEIPKASDRWAQANFDQASFFGFFGASRTVQRRAYFFHLREDGTLGFQEVRPAVAVMSKNYRFELDAASGLAYPDEGRPIGVFAKVVARTFVYMLLMPGQAGHAAMAHLLDSVQPTSRFLRRRVFSAAEVQAAWPGAPFWI